MAIQATVDFVPVARTNELASGAMKAVKVGNKEVLIARVGEKFYAASNVCPHMGAQLAMGRLEGTVVTCPRHASKFDLVDGHVIRWTDWTGIKASVSKLFRSPHPLTIYPVKIEGDNILVKVEG